ncbi:MAG TPA: hypothetical protein VGZ72_21870 [Stellaceae bacterium]|nr:hypothetical protein [Stellaceae bacterium]
MSCLLGLSGIATLFLPFTFNNSPWDVTGGQVFQSEFDFYFSYFLLGAPFLLAVPISAASLLLLITRRLVQPCWIAGYALAFAAAAGTSSLVGAAMIYWAHDSACAIPSLAILIGGGALVVTNVRLGLPHAQNGIIAMQVAFAAGALLPVFVYFGEWNIGAYITLITIVVYASHVVAVELVVRGTCEASRG